LGKLDTHGSQRKPGANEMATRRELRVAADFKQAAALLKDKNLVWSADLDCIRQDLANYIEAALTDHTWQSATLQRIVQALIADENDLSI
jgi:hypothetical protein